MQRKVASKKNRKNKIPGGVEILDNHHLGEEILIAIGPCDFPREKQISNFLDTRIEKSKKSAVTYLTETDFSQFASHTTLTYAGHAYYNHAPTEEGVSSGSRRQRNVSGAKQNRHYAHALLSVNISEIAQFAVGLIQSGVSNLNTVNLFGCYTAVTPRKDMDFTSPSYGDNDYSLCEALCLSLHQYHESELPEDFTVNGSLGAVTFNNGKSGRVKINGTHYNMVEKMPTDPSESSFYIIDKKSGFAAINVNKFTRLWVEKTGRHVSSWSPTLFKPTKEEQELAERYAASHSEVSDSDSDSDNDSTYSENRFSMLNNP